MAPFIGSHNLGLPFRGKDQRFCLPPANVKIVDQANHGRRLPDPLHKDPALVNSVANQNAVRSASRGRALSLDRPGDQHPSVILPAIPPGVVRGHASVLSAKYPYSSDLRESPLLVGGRVGVRGSAEGEQETGKVFGERNTSQPWRAWRSLQLLHWGRRSAWWGSGVPTTRAAGLHRGEWGPQVIGGRPAFSRDSPMREARARAPVNCGTGLAARSGEAWT